VFLTAYDGDHLLHVANQTPDGFTVQAQDDTASGRFSWRVVAKRKDIAAPRFETVEIPTEPVLPNIPEPPAAPDQTTSTGGSASERIGGAGVSEVYQARSRRTERALTSAAK
jgi:hypothetical protein